MTHLERWGMAKRERRGDIEFDTYIHTPACTHAADRRRKREGGKERCDCRSVWV